MLPPHPRPVATERLPVGDVALAVHHWGGVGRPLLLVHGTGLHGMVWSSLARRLVDHGLRVVSYDARGHGDSDAPETEYCWDEFASDLVGLVDQLSLVEGSGGPTVLAHSMGATTALLAEALAPGTFDRLWLFEPIVYPQSPPPGPQTDHPMVERTRVRRRSWDRLETAFANYAAKQPFDDFVTECLAAYVTHGLRCNGDDYVLKCDPEVEARVFAMSGAHDAYGQLPSIECPAWVVCGEASARRAHEWAHATAAALPEGTLQIAPGVGHFGPFERPETVVELVSEFLDSSATRRLTRTARRRMT